LVIVIALAALVFGQEAAQGKIVTEIQGVVESARAIVLPDAEVPWRDVWIGAGITALLFAISQLFIGLYLGKRSIGSAYGPAG
jgi:hypothetical protein